MRPLLALLLVSLAVLSPLFALEAGKPLPSLELSSKEGGKVDGTAFKSDTLKDKVTVLFYVDPDKKDLNEEFVQRLKEQKFDRSRYRSVAVINMAATWMPDFAIAAALKSKQKKYPDTVYVKDRVKKGVEVWNMADDDANIAVIDPNGVVLYARSGKIPESEYEKIISLIRLEMAKL